MFLIDGHLVEGPPADESQDKALHMISFNSMEEVEKSFLVVTEPTRNGGRRPTGLTHQLSGWEDQGDPTTSHSFGMPRHDRGGNGSA